MSGAYNFPLLGAIAVCVTSCSADNSLYAAAEEWARRSPIITQDTGEILSVTPAGDLEQSCAFTDGCSARFTLEVEGENGVGSLRMIDAFINRGPDRAFYLSGAFWNWQGEKVAIHGKSGLRYEDYISLPNQLQVITEEIERTGGYQEAYYIRALINWLLANKPQAYEDIQLAIDLEAEAKQNQLEVNPELYEPFREAPRVPAVFQTFDGNYSSALENVETLLSSHEEGSVDLVEDYLLRWFIQTESGQLATANQNLAAACGLPSDVLSGSEAANEEEAQRLFKLITKDYECGPRLSGSPYFEYLMHITDQTGEATKRIENRIEDVDDMPDRYDSSILIAKTILERIRQQNN